MKHVFYVLLVLTSTNLLSQSSSESDRIYRLINEIIRDNYNDKIVRLDSIPCNDKISIDGSYLQQHRELISDNLNKNELGEFLKFCDSSKCYLPTNRLEQTIKLCNSDSILITDLNRRLKPSLNVNSFKWAREKIITKSKGFNYYDLSFSEPIFNNNETILIIHIITNIGVYGYKGETILFRKINNRWSKICNLHAWIT